jgi:hypothetical protein
MPMTNSLGEVVNDSKIITLKNGDFLFSKD